MNKILLFLALLLLMTACYEATGGVERPDERINTAPSGILNIFYNSFAVYLDDELIGHIMISDSLTSEDFHNNAVLHLQTAIGGANVMVEQQVTIEPARARRRDIFTHSEIFAILNRRFDYAVAAIEVYVNGELEALLRTETDLEHVKYLLQSVWFTEYTVSAEFVNGWETVTRYVCPDETEFCTPEQAYWRLDRTTVQTHNYTVQIGDNFSGIAARFGSTVDRIAEENNLTSVNSIAIGDVLVINTYMPLLTVRTVDEIGDLRIIRENGVEVLRETH